MRVTVDRIEDGFIVAELPDGSFGDLPLCFAPQAVEGNVINIEIDVRATRDRSQDMRTRLDKLFGKED